MLMPVGQKPPPRPAHSVRPQRVVRTMSLPGVTFTYILRYPYLYLGTCGEQGRARYVLR